MSINTTPGDMLVPAADCRARVACVVAFFETLTPASVQQAADLYAPDARFIDPFNDVNGPRAIAGIFAHMFVALERPRFVVTAQLVQGCNCFLTWELHFKFKRFLRHRPQVIVGASHLVFSTQGLVTLHRDYWDAAQGLYEKLPVIGSLMRWLKGRAMR